VIDATDASYCCCFDEPTGAASAEAFHDSQGDGGQGVVVAAAALLLAGVVDDALADVATGWEASRPINIMRARLL
jgi:hypothetical protein